MLGFQLLLYFVRSIQLRNPVFLDDLFELSAFVAELRGSFLDRIYSDKSATVLFIFKKNLSKLSGQRLHGSCSYLNHSQTVLAHVFSLKELLHFLHLVCGFSFNPVEVIPHIDVWSQDAATLPALGYLLCNSANPIQYKRPVRVNFLFQS